MGKSKSLTTTGIQLPDLTQQAQVAVVSGGTGTPFVGFASNKSGNIDELKAAGIAPGDAYLGGDTLTPLKPLRFHLTHYYQCWAETDDGYNAIEVVETEPEDKRSPLKEIIESVLLVYVGDSLVPATCTWRGPRCSAVKAALKQLREMDDNWGKKSPAHAIAAKVGTPSLRIVTTVKTSMRTAKTSGRAYIDAKGRCSPVTTSELDAIDRFFKGSPDAMTDVVQSYENRVASLKELV